MVTNSKNIIKHNLVATNTLYDPQNNDKEKLMTWISSDSNIKKQLDYIMISQKHKNWIKTQGQKGIAIIEQIYQHRILQMDITMRLRVNPNNDDGRKGRGNIT